MGMSKQADAEVSWYVSGMEDFKDESSVGQETVLYSFYREQSMIAILEQSEQSRSKGYENNS